MPERWPTGVLWTCGDMSTIKWQYKHNPIQCREQITVETGAGNLVVRIFEGSDVS